MIKVKRTINDTDRNEQELLTLEASVGYATLLESALRSVDGQSDYIDITGFKKGLFVLNITGANGTTPTLNIKLQVYDGANWIDLGENFPEQVGAGTTVLKVTDLIGERLRVDYAFGGTTPDFTFSVKAVLE